MKVFNFMIQKKLNLFIVRNNHLMRMTAKNRDFTVLRCAAFFFFYLISPSYCNAIYNITLSQTLFQGQTLVSQKEVFELGFFTPNKSGNKYVGIWFKQISPPKIVWVANRENPLAVGDSSASLTINRNGNLELLDGKNKSVWSTNVSVSSNTTVAILMDNGNFILKDGKSGEKLWESFSHPGDTFVTGTVEIKFGDRLVLTSWKSESDPSIGDFIVGLSLKSPPEAVVWNGTIPHWRSGPWDKTKFIGIPDADVSYLNLFDLVQDLDNGKLLFSFNKFYNSTIANLYISPDGVLKVMRHNKEQNYWYASWEVPQTKCDVYGTCGSYGVCKASESPMCKCLKGFVPKSFEEWRQGNWTGGCVRQTQLLCTKNASHTDPEKGKIDVFWKMGNMKLPDFYEYVQVPDPDTCKSRCLNNCSCLVYTYVNGIGCLFWSKEFIDTQEFSSGGAEFYIRLSPSELAGGNNNKKLVICLVVAIPGGVILGVIIFICCRRRSNQKRNTLKITRHFDTVETSDTSREAFQGTRQHESADLPIYDFDSILIATDNFSITNKLGQGGFGTVYKGKLRDGTEIAVKRLSSSSGQGIEELKNEMILISKLQHRNLVRLLGCCIENEEKLLIYEFMSNKSLDTFLFDPTRKTELFWARRFNIIHGIARGLLYLHRDSALRVIHRDLKVSNILLDEKMNPKISDFGLARIFQGTFDLTNTHRVVGTLGYMSPEYAMGGVFSEKSDVFSFGVLLLEIVSGMKNSSFHYRDEHLSLIAYAWNLWSEGKALQLMDESLAGSNSSVEVIRCIHVALLCVQDHAMERPNMADVVFMLTNETDRRQPKQPIFTFQSSLHFDFQLQSATSGSTYSVNEATMSIVEPR